MVLVILLVACPGCTDSNSVTREEAAAPAHEESAVAPIELPDSPSQDEAAPSQEVCPVMGGKVNRAIYTDYKGKRVYFCCPPCVKAFNSDPEKYLKLLEEQGIEPDVIK